MKKLIFGLMILGFAQTAFSQELKSVDNTLNAGKVEWLVRQVRAEDIPYGKPHKADFPFKNISSEPMYINWVKTSCHCTATNWPKEPIPAGETGVITVEYDALTEGTFYKIVSVLTSFDPRAGVPLVITGKVVKTNPDK